MKFVREPFIPNDEIHVYSCLPDVAFVGITAWKRLEAELLFGDPDAWYEAEVARMAERAPA